MKRLITILVISSVLSGCSGLSIATTGAQVAYDRYDFQKNFTDHEIALAIEQKLSNDPELTHNDLDITCFNGQVLLVGNISSAALRKKVAKIAAYTPDVDHVYNFIEIAPPQSLKSHMRDTWITSKIKSTIIMQAKMSPNSIKIVTDNGIVYLMAFLTPEQAKIAVDTARYTSGVTRVVEIFQYITYSRQLPTAQS